MIALHHCRTFSSRLRPRWVHFFSNITSRMGSSTTGNVKWLWELNEDQKSYHFSHLRGTRIGAFVITLNTSKPLTVEDFLVSVEHMQRKLPHLTIGIRKRGDSLWFYQPASLKPNIKVMKEDCDLGKEIMDMIQTGIHSPETTLWGGRITFLKENAVCLTPEVKATHPYQYRFIYTGHHGLMDGIGALSFLKVLFEILTKVANDTPVDDKQFVSFVEEKEMHLILTHLKAKLKKSAEFSEAVKNTLPLPESTPLFFKVFPPPNPSELKTKHVVKVLEPNEFDRLKLKSREEGVTFNSVAVAAINTAIVELARENGILADSYEISPIVITNLRRYLKQSSDFSFSPHGGFLSLKSAIDENSRANFWHYCKLVDGNIRSHLKEGLPLHQKAFRSLNTHKQPPHCLNDYCLTNLGDASYIFPDNSDSLLRVSHLASVNLIDGSLYSNLHELVTFQGRLFYTFSYLTNFLNDESAHYFIDRIFAVIERVAKTSR